jgi:hypothetical protein
MKRYFSVPQPATFGVLCSGEVFLGTDISYHRCKARFLFQKSETRLKQKSSKHHLERIYHIYINDFS